MLRKKYKNIFLLFGSQRILGVVAAFVATVVIACFAAGSVASAASTTVSPPVLFAQATPPPIDAPAKPVKADCNGPDIQAGLAEDDENHCGILDYLVLFIQVLSAIVGIVVVGVFIVSGIQYSASGSDPNSVAAAKKRIVSAIVALAVYAFMFAFLEFIIPGGVL